MRALILMTLLAASGCHSFDPVGTYEGDATRSSTVSRMTTDLADDGSAQANTSRSSSNDTGVRVVVTRVDERHLELALGNLCSVRAQQSPEPNDHQATIVMAPPQICHLRLEGYEGDVPMNGSVELGRDDPQTLNVSMTGSENRGNPDRAGFTAVTFSYSFRGTLRQQ